MESVHIPVKESILFSIKEDEIELFQTVIKAFKINHNPSFIKQITDRVYLYHPGHHVVFKPIVQGMIQYTKLGGVVISFKEWHQLYLFDNNNIMNQQSNRSTQ